MPGVGPPIQRSLTMPPREPSSRVRPRVVALSLLVAALLSVAPVWGSMFGEENTTLVQMLVQLLQIESDMGELNKVAGEIGDTANALLSTYQQVNAGIDALRSYSFDAFLNDLKV